MDKDTLKKLSNDPQNIKGIYNYCDYWCERCPFTSRCLNYKTGQEAKRKLTTAGGTPKHTDDENREFWESIHQNFETVKEMLREEAKRFGIDIDNLPEMPETELRENQVKDYVKNHPLSVMAEEYGFGTMKWFEKQGKENFREELEKTLRQEFVIAGNETEMESKAMEIKNAMEIINWYLFQISVKLKRALTDKAHGKIYGDGYDEDFLYDANGSAKVSLIGIDRSIWAWNVFLRAFGGYEDFILKTLATLEKLRKSIEKEFPEARKFVRPGFDW